MNFGLDSAKKAYQLSLVGGARKELPTRYVVDKFPWTDRSLSKKQAGNPLAFTATLEIISTGRYIDI